MILFCIYSFIFGYAGLHCREWGLLSLWILTPYAIYICKYFLLFHRLSFPFVGGFLCCAEFFCCCCLVLIYFCFCCLCLCWAESRSVVSSSLWPPWTVVHGILQARILEWVAVFFSRGSSQSRDQTQVSLFAGGFFTCWATREAHAFKVKSSKALPKSI